MDGWTTKLHVIHRAKKREVGRSWKSKPACEVSVNPPENGNRAPECVRYLTVY